MKDTVGAVIFLLRISWRNGRRQLTLGAVLILLGFAATPLVAVAAREAVNAALAADEMTSLRWSVATGIALTCELYLAHFAHLYYFELGEINEKTLTSELISSISEVSLERLDSPEFLDSIAILKQDIVRMRESVSAVFKILAIVVQLVITSVVVARLQIWLAALPLASAIPVVLGHRAELVLERGRREAASVVRQLARLRSIATSPDTLPELRILGVEELLLSRHHSLQTRAKDILLKAQWKHAAWRAVGQGAFAAAYAPSVAFVIYMVKNGSVTVGDVVLLVTLITRVSAQVVTGLDLFASLHSVANGFDILRHLNFADLKERGSDGALPIERISTGISLEDVEYTYRGMTTPAVSGVNLHLPAGSTVAIVGENGAGKSTLVKIISGLYRPTRGRVRVDDVDLGEQTPESWRARVSTLFQDFARLEFSVQESVGVGHLPDIDNRAAVLSAFRRASSGKVVDDLPHGLDTLLGLRHEQGRALSGGQWQSVGLARSLMRPKPLLLVLDEPGHSLDALAEEQVAEAYLSAAKDVAYRSGGVTCFVTHRLSTAQLADRIVVVDRGSVVEVGTHEDLMARRQKYFELFELQSRGYVS